MTRPKGTPNKKVATVKYTTETGPHKETLTENDLIDIPNVGIPIEPYVEFYKHVAAKDILLSIIDALYDKDGDAATWKPIRDKIGAL